MGVERDAKGWPILHAAQDFACDGINPRTDARCILGRHKGFHRDDDGDEWLDDGDLARPDWLEQRP
ncbi:hypothetical protein [Kribbella shirazensis]|uniref:Uncharacterized protein n=1 Tax=Kribbella shirazensis TaxID=1105143 RepID=A0A7X6A1J3_9ACTN|nr:hypothetical protein [Kribbella shirazensis]NIK57905.1 hypothetical protein [Kribbella shirazensis]